MCVWCGFRLSASFLNSILSHICSPPYPLEDLTFHISFEDMEHVDLVARSGQRTAKGFENHILSKIKNNRPDPCPCPLYTGVNKKGVDTGAGTKAHFDCKGCGKRQISGY